MTGYSKVFLDTTPLIYFLDNDIHFGDKVRKIFEEILEKGQKMVSSSITCAEYLVYPYRTRNQEKIDVFFEFTGDNGIELIPVTVETAKRAAAIRAEYRDFKAMDSLQLAIAVETNCDLFLTNDKQLRQFRDLKCITVEEWNFSLVTSPI